MATARPSKPIPLPAAVRRGGRQGWIVAAIGGAVTSAVTLLVPVLLSTDAAFGFLAVCGLASPPGSTSASDVIRYALTSVQERLSEVELREAVIKHVHSEAKLYPGRARRGLPPDSSSQGA